MRSGFTGEYWVWGGDNLGGESNQRKRVHIRCEVRRVYKESEIILTIQRRNFEYIGRHERREISNIMQRKIQGMRSIIWCDKWFGYSHNELFRAAVSKVKKVGSEWRIHLKMANIAEALTVS